MISVIPKSFKDSLAISKFYLATLLTSLFFATRHVFLAKSAYFTGAYSDFTSFSLYLSDILVFMGFLVFFVPNYSEIVAKFFPKALKALIIWLFIVTIFHAKSPNLSLNVWFLGKFLELIVAYGTIAYLFSKHNIFSFFMRSFVVLASLESVLAIYQFWTQASLGLHKLGETVLSSDLLGIAKIVSGGTVYIRAYGTFPHPNPFSAFLLVSTIFTLHLYISSQKYKEKLLWINILFVNLLGLALTFSRAGILTLGIGLIVFFGLLWWNNIKRDSSSFAKAREDRSDTLRMTPVIVIVMVMAMVSFFLFKPLLLSRTTISDQASIERIKYAKAGIKLIKENPIFGTGLGESVLHMEHATGKTLEPWQKQPVHNYFLLVGTELGTPGVLILIWFFLSVLKPIIYNLKTNSTYYLLLATCFIAFLILMQFDHYFYTLEQTQLLLWIMLGVIFSQVKNPNPPIGEKRLF